MRVAIIVRPAVALLMLRTVHAMNEAAAGSWPRAPAAKELERRIDPLARSPKGSGLRGISLEARETTIG